MPQKTLTMQDLATLTKSIALNKETHKIFLCLFSIDFFPVTSVSGDSLGNACLEIKLVYPAVLSLDRQQGRSEEYLSQSWHCYPDKSNSFPSAMPPKGQRVHLAVPDTEKSLLLSPPGFGRRPDVVLVAHLHPAP